MAFFQPKSHNDDLKFILKIITNIKLIVFYVIYKDYIKQTLNGLAEICDIKLKSCLKTPIPLKMFTLFASPK